MKNLKKLSIGLAIVGLMLGTVLIGWFGFGRIATAILSAGIAGFSVFCGWQLIVMAILGGAWRATAPAGQGALPIFIWGRMVRDSAASCLPFSAVGGFVLGARAVALYGVTRSVATLSTIVDLTAEFVAEIAFAVAGGLVLLARSTDSAIVIPTEIGLCVAIVIGIVTIRLQRGMAPLFARMGRRILGGWIDDKNSGAKIPEADLAAMYGDSSRLALSTAIHLVGWIGKGLGNWIGFRLLGAHIGVIDGMAIEGLLHVMLAAAIVVPGYAGVQEAGYAGLGALFGIPAEISLGVSLLRRARDIAIGIPILLFWQLIEVRRLRVN